MRLLAAFFLASVTALAFRAVTAAETWRWLGKTNLRDDGKSIAYGQSCWTTNNWLNLATGLSGIPRSGDLVTTAGVGQFGQDFDTSLAFGGVTVTSSVSGEFVSQGTLTLQAGGEGLVLSSDVKSVGTLNGHLAFVGAGDGVVSVANADCVLSIQKSCCGNGDVTLVKRGPGALRVNDYYRPDGSRRDSTSGYYAHRKFVFGGVRLQEGSLVVRQYYTVTELDFLFDGTTAVLDLCGTNPSADDGSHAPVSWRLKGGGFGESDRCSPGAHRVTAQSAAGVLELVGTREDSLFTGTFTGAAGLVWNPDNAAEFVFARTVSDTTGYVTVSNGTVRLTQGAGFPSVSGLEVSGSNAVFRVDETANGDLGGVPVRLNGGGTLSLGTDVSVKSLTVDGTPVAAGVYSGQAWQTGADALVVGGGVAEWDGTGSAFALTNWAGATQLPLLDVGVTRVNVTGGESFVADRDVSVAGFAIGVPAFSLSATEGHALKIGRAGLTNAVSGAVTLGGGGGRIVVAAPQTWYLNAGALNVLGSLDSENGAVLIRGTQSPAFPDGGVVACDLRWAQSGTIVCPAGKELTFDGVVTTTNTQNLSVSAEAGSTVTFNRLMMSRNGGTLSGSGRIVFKDAVHFRDRPNMSGSVTVELHADGNRLNGNMGTFSGGTLRTMRAYAVTRANARRQPVTVPATETSVEQSADGGQNTMINSKDDFVFDLNGYDQSIDMLAMHADGVKSGGTVRSATSATLHLQTAAACWPQHNYRYGFTDFKAISSADGYGYETADKGRWEGGVNLSYEAADGKVRSMMRVSSSTGRVEVVSGRLVFLRRARFAGETFDLKGGTANPYPRLTDEDGAWPLATAVTVTGGTLKLEHALAFGRDVALSLNTGGVLELDEGVVLGCRTLTVDGVVLAPGRSYGAEDTPCIQGAGRVYVRGANPISALSVR